MASSTRPRRRRSRHSPPRRMPSAFGAFVRRRHPQILPLTRSLPGNWAGRRLAFALRQIAHLVAARPAGRRRDASARGCGSIPTNNVCEKRLLFTPQFFDPDERAFLRSASSRGFVFVDVGRECRRLLAVRGGAWRAVRAGAGRRAAAAHLRAARLQHPPELRRHGEGAGLRRRRQDRRRHPVHGREERTANPASRSSATPEGRSIRVPAKTLLQLLQDEGFEHVDAMKIDVEGRGRPDPRAVPAHRAREPAGRPPHHRERRRTLAGRPRRPAAGEGLAAGPPHARQPDLRAQLRPRAAAGARDGCPHPRAPLVSWRSRSSPARSSSSMAVDGRQLRNSAHARPGALLHRLPFRQHRAVVGEAHQHPEFGHR